MCSETILIVRPGALGDTILTIPLIHTVRTIHPHAQITFLGTRRYRDIIPRWVSFQAFDAIQWLWLLARDEIEHPPKPPSFDLAYVILARPGEVIRNLEHAGTKVVKYASAAAQSGIHVVTHLHRAFGFDQPLRRAALADMVPREKTDTIWVHPGSGGPHKCIPLTQMAALLSQLRGLTGYRVVVTMSEEDRFLLSAPGWTSLIDASSTEVLTDLGLQEVCRRAGTARLFIGNDSGISHLAANLGVPAAVFFVRTDPLVWAPWTPLDMTHLIDVRNQDLGTLDLTPFHSPLIELATRDIHA